MDDAQKTEIVDGLKVTHPGTDLYSYESAAAGEFFVHRRATKDERRIYRQLIADDKKLDAQDSLMSCVLYPDKAGLKKKLDDAPFAIEMLVDAILSASGIYLDGVRKKL